MHTLRSTSAPLLPPLSLAANAQTCADQPSDKDATYFGRPHQVPHAAEGMRTIKRNDGTTVEVPALAEVTDGLVLWRQTSAGVCFPVTTYARNGHECSVQGLAVATAQGGFLFTDRKCSIRLRLLNGNRVRLQPLGPDCKQDHCGLFGVIEAATYARR